MKRCIEKTVYVIMYVGKCKGFLNTQIRIFTNLPMISWITLTRYTQCET